MSKQVINAALAELQKLVEQGVEYPDAEARVFNSFQLTDEQCDAVIAAYDAADAAR